MRNVQIRFFTVAILVVVAVACSRTLPTIAHVTGAQSVQIIATTPEGDSCVRLSTETVSDGKIGRGRLGYEGTEARAVLRLRNRAAELGGDAILLVDPEAPENRGLGLPVETIAMDCGGQCGSIVWKTAIVFRCGG